MLSGGQFGIGKQLPLFVTPREIRAGGEAGEIVHGDQNEFTSETLEHLYGRKVRNSMRPDRYHGRPDKPGLYERIEKEGVQEPVSIFLSEDDPTTRGRDVPHARLYNGHHRVAVQHDIDPDAHMPVNFDSPSSRAYSVFAANERETREWTGRLEAQRSTSISDYDDEPVDDSAWETQKRLNAEFADDEYFDE